MLRGFSTLSSHLWLFRAKSRLVIDEMLREEIFEEHDCDVGLSSAGFQVNDVPVTHPVVRPIASYPVVDAQLVGVRCQLLKPQIHVDWPLRVLCQIQSVLILWQMEI